MNIPSAYVLNNSPAFRDLGGLVTVDGRQVRHGILFRADELSSLDESDRAVINTLGLRLVCDLRSRDERERTPCLSWLQPQPRVLQLEMAAAAVIAATAPSLARLLRGPDPAAATAIMQATYSTLPHSAAPFLASLFDALAAGASPALVHCTAGKDRTGFTVAMILSALGVSRETIYGDYLIGSGRDPLALDQPSSHMMQAILGRELEPEEATRIHGVHREYLDAAFAVIDSGWGDSQQYLHQAVGVDAARRHTLQQMLLA